MDYIIVFLGLHFVFITFVFMDYASYITPAKVQLFLKYRNSASFEDIISPTPPELY